MRSPAASMALMMSLPIFSMAFTMADSPSADDVAALDDDDDEALPPIGIVTIVRLVPSAAFISAAIRSFF